MTTQCVVRAAERPSRSETLDVPKNIANSPKAKRLRSAPCLKGRGPRSGEGIQLEISQIHPKPIGDDEIVGRDVLDSPKKF